MKKLSLIFVFVMAFSVGCDDDNTTNNTNNINNANNINNVNNTNNVNNVNNVNNTSNTNNINNINNTNNTNNTNNINNTNNTEITPEIWAAGFAVDHCEKLLLCCGNGVYVVGPDGGVATNQAECETIFIDYAVDLTNMNGVSIDSAYHEDCSDAILSMFGGACNEEFQGAMIWDIAGCDNFLVGSLASGGMCEEDFQCGDGMICFAEECSVIPLGGESCNDIETCVEPFVCAGPKGTQYCLAGLTENTVCDHTNSCENTLYCGSDDTCVPKKVYDESCENGFECLSDVCDNNFCQNYMMMSINSTCYVD